MMPQGADSTATQMLLRVIAILALISLMAEGAQRQRWRGRRYEPPVPLELTITPSYSFARVQFQSFRSGRNPGWSHDYPRAERNLLRILSEVTNVHTEPAAHTIVQLASDEITRYPILYFSEPGEWAITPEEAENFRAYLGRGGFAIFDDFDGPWDWENFESCMRLVLPGQHLELLALEDPVFQSFFHIKSLEMTNPTGRSAPSFWGIRDDAGRVQVVANFNNDIGEYWEWSEQGYYPIELSNEGYKLGINYIIYALTH
ncbi:MAG: hypothetical protein BMS9Abin37_2973 [Acidobacteriota bacterium]|nr:MAG: hypothetical protein BMS9Abin37_2973 [Acidobacteriota bacterium]